MKLCNQNNYKKNFITILSVSIIKSKILLNLASLYWKACNVEKKAKKANHDEFLYWYHYINNQVKNTRKSNQIGKKKVKSRNMLLLLLNITPYKNDLSH